MVVNSTTMISSRCREPGFETGIRLSSTTGKVSIRINHYRNVPIPIEDITAQNLDEGPARQRSPTAGQREQHDCL